MHYTLGVKVSKTSGNLEDLQPEMLKVRTGIDLITDQYLTHLFIWDADAGVPLS